MYKTLKTYGVVASVVLLAGYLLYRAALPRPIPGIPYNKEATRNLFGDIPVFLKWHAERQELFAWLAEQCVKLDSPVFQVFMRPFGKPWVVIADFRESQDIMVRRTREFDRSAFMGDLFISILPNQQVHMPTGDEWRAHRRLMADTMSPAFLNNVVGPQIFRISLDVIELWKQKTRLAQGRPFEAVDDIFRGALDVIWAATFGSEIGTTKSQINMLSRLNDISLPKDVDCPAELPSAPTPAAFDSIITLTQSVEIAMKSPFPRQHHSFALKFFPYLRSAVKHKEQLVKEQLDVGWKKFSEGSDNDDQVMSAMDLIIQREVITAKKEGRPPQYDTRVIKDELFGYLVAGHDTTSTTICWGLKYLTQDQPAQEKLRSALHSHFRDASQEDRNPSVDEITKAEIPYLNAALEEVLRCSGTVSTNIRTTVCGTQVLGHHIPKGTDVFMVSLVVISSEQTSTESRCSYPKVLTTWLHR